MREIKMLVENIMLYNVKLTFLNGNLKRVSLELYVISISTF